MTSYLEEMGWEFGRFLKNPGSWSPTMVLRSWDPTMMLRSWSLTMQLMIWDWTMQTDNLVSAIVAEKRVLCHRVAFSTVVAAVKFFGSRPAKMNWDLKHNVLCRTLRVLLAYYDYEILLRIVSLLVSKNWNQNLINRSYLINGVRLCFVFDVFEYVFIVPLLLISPNYTTEAGNMIHENQKNIQRQPHFKFYDD